MLGKTTTGDRQLTPAIPSPWILAFCKDQEPVQVLAVSVAFEK